MWPGSLAPSASVVSDRIGGQTILMNRESHLNEIDRLTEQLDLPVFRHEASDEELVNSSAPRARPRSELVLAHCDAWRFTHHRHVVRARVRVQATQEPEEP